MEKGKRIEWSVGTFDCKYETVKGIRDGKENGLGNRRNDATRLPIMRKISRETILVGKMSELFGTTGGRSSDPPGSSGSRLPTRVANTFMSGYRHTITRADGGCSEKASKSVPQQSTQSIPSDNDGNLSKDDEETLAAPITNSLSSSVDTS